MSTSDGDRLIEYLVDRDERCPSCGYNLRNLTKDTCPECRQHLRLAVGLRDMRLGPFVMTIAPGIFSGISAVLLGVLLMIAMASGGSPPWQFAAVEAFGIVSGLLTLSLIVHRHVFMRLRTNAQVAWAVVAWAIHILAFVAFLLALVYL